MPTTGMVPDSIPEEHPQFLLTSAETSCLVQAQLPTADTRQGLPIILTKPNPNPNQHLRVMHSVSHIPHTTTGLWGSRPRTRGSPLYELLGGLCSIVSWHACRERNPARLYLCAAWNNQLPLPPVGGLLGLECVGCDTDWYSLWWGTITP